MNSNTWRTPLQVKIKPEESSNSNRVPLWTELAHIPDTYALRIKAATWPRIDELIREIVDRIPLQPDLPFHHYFSCSFAFSFYESKIYFIVDKIFNEFFSYHIIFELEKKQLASRICGVT